MSPGVSIERHARVTITTPEHVSLGFELAPVSSRFLAMLLDGAAIAGSLLALGLLGILIQAGFSDVGAYPMALLLVALFFLRNFYFIFFELRWEGRTLGKRALGLRVIARDGGGLSAEMVFARNLTRELEIFLPLLALIAPASVLGGLSSWERAACGIWLLIIALMPFFNRHRARVGDLVAGTVVVVTPRATLLPDLVTAQVEGRRAPPRELTFTDAQLDIYGIHELQVLEDVLRGEVASSDELLASITERVQRKIGWHARNKVDPETFLRAFYQAQRKRLEQKMLFGKRQERKVR
ncbi:RDD family protein [Chondromyces apiculatus]|uniref:RDD domain-containing protein n=1 Tax=Chondromyces apiculatus DSM 436 TaxID=1192034 RepID=A0A017TDQ0_9BACT|nr:RDD family protein [Chondromyces apiculatus]EYF06935.1 Hypothetical protein CAP_1193 [Chondromyces apiculatus DSM 436]